MNQWLALVRPTLKTDPTVLGHVGDDEATLVNLLNFNNHPNKDLTDPFAKRISMQKQVVDKVYGPGV